MKHSIRFICAFLAAALALTCCPLESRAERVTDYYDEDVDYDETEVRTWNGFDYAPESEGDFEDGKSEPIFIVNYKGTKRELTIPKKIDGMKVVSVSSLSRAKNLRTLHIPNGIKVHTAVTKAPKLKKITVSKSNKRYSVKNNALLNKKGTVLMGYPGGYSTLKIPDSVTRIPYGFYGKRFKRIQWGKNVREIESRAFLGNRNLKTLKVNNKVEVIGEKAFEDCIKLKKVVLGKNVRRIERGAFNGCRSLKSVYIYNRNCKIAPRDRYEYNDCFPVPPNATIYGWKGSTAEKYAKKYKIKFKALK